VTRGVGRIGITGPCGSAGMAPHELQDGVGGMMPSHMLGTVTAPPQMEHVPMVFFMLTQHRNRYQYSMAPA
jgi:hypothetical protein